MNAKSRVKIVKEGLVFEVPVGNDERETFDVCLLRFDDEARPVHPEQLKFAIDSILRARAGYQRAEGGALVVIFIHGWHHDATWDPERGTGDEHFRDFRLLLKQMARRELERNAEITRRVVGVYIGWNGDPPGSTIWRMPMIKNLKFWNRFQIARRLGESVTFHEAFDAIVRAVKDQTPNNWGLESPLVLVGHSMGALIAQMCVRRLLALEAARDEAVQANVATCPQAQGILRAETTSRHGRFAFPDLVITLNSAANAWIARDIRDLLNRLKMRREPTDGRVSYLAPIVISATARCDWVTRYVWRVANWPQKTDGHSDDLHSHDVRKFGPAHCAPGDARRSFGQAWHCLRCPEPISHDTPTFRVDLPARSRLDSTTGNRAWQHVRYILSPRPEQAQKRSPFWVFLLPRAISCGHNDIFNYRLSLLILALMQISGAAVSLATTWSEVFESETADAGGRGP